VTPAGPIIGTAGHVDHGKTALIRALTGTDLDALPEERARGITIALGFTAAHIEGKRMAFIDVPGHESLVRTMVAGAVGMDAVMLCISAVDGVMPQTREHLGICNALGIASGIVVLTQADRVDAELLELAEEEAREAVEDTFLAACPIIATSATEGTGLSELRAALSKLSPQTRTKEGIFRLPVDRVFHRDGFGLIATGTVASGQCTAGKVLTAQPIGASVRVRALQVHGEGSDQATAGQRVALNLAGAGADDIKRGIVLTDGSVPSTHVIDVRLTALPDAPELLHDAPVRILLGTSEALGRVYLTGTATALSASGQHTAQLRLDTPIPCLPADRFVLRRPSPEDTLAGGEVLDPWAPKMRQRDRVRVGAELKRLADGDRGVLLERAGEGGLSHAEVRERGLIDLGVVLGDRVVSASIVGRLEGRLLEALRAFHTDHALALGANRRELHRGKLQHLSDRAFDALTHRLTDAGLAQISGALIRLNGFAITLTEAQQSESQAILTTVGTRGLEGLKRADLHEAHPQEQTAALAQLLATDAQITDVNGIGWVANVHLDELTKRVRDWLADNGRLDTQQFKELTGLSRRAAIPLLEWLDAQRITQRDGDARRLHSSAGRQT